MNVASVESGLPGCVACSSKLSIARCIAGRFRTAAKALLFTNRSYCSRSRSEAERKAASLGTTATPPTVESSPRAAAFPCTPVSQSVETSSAVVSAVVRAVVEVVRRQVATRAWIGATIGEILCLVIGIRMP